MKIIGWFIQQVRRFSPRCREAARIISDVSDYHPPLLDRTGLFLHVLICPPCRRYQKSVSFLKMAMKGMDKFIVTGQQQRIPADARERLRGAVNVHGGTVQD